MIDAQSLFDAPDQYLFSFEGASAILAEMDRDAYQRSIFLDRRISPKSRTVQRVNLAELYAAQASAQPKARPCYIFHVAFCGSTLLARALDVRDANLVYREPQALRQLGTVAAGPALPDAATQRWLQCVELVVSMLGRRYAKAGPAIVKANVPVNFMLPALLEPAPDTPAIALYFGLENYALAALRDPDHRDWVGRVSQELRFGLDTLTGTTTAATLAEAAARLWLAQMLAFDTALRQFPGLMSLDAEEMFTRPADVLDASFAHFGQSMSAGDVNAIVTGELFARHSKNPTQKFDNTERLARRQQRRVELADELAAAFAWVNAHPKRDLLPKALAKPLLGESPRLLETA